jgi:hypothetical protein
MEAKENRDKGITDKAGMVDGTKEKDKSVSQLRLGQLELEQLANIKRHQPDNKQYQAM